MDEATARRLVEAWCKSDREAATFTELPSGGFYVGRKSGTLELAYKEGVLTGQQSPANFPLDAPPDAAEVRRVTAIHTQKAAKLGPTRTEYGTLHSKPGKWFILLRIDFTDEKITEEAFVKAIDSLGKYSTAWRR
jgi:hypothetical protein